MENPLKRRFALKQKATLSWLLIPSAFAAESMAQAGFDGLIVDMQHGVQDYHSMVACFQALHAHPVARMARVPANEAGIIGKTLDAGAHGVICPMIGSGAEAEALVRACKYPPRGTRSNGPVRAGLYNYGPSSYQMTANDETLVIAMIETKAGVDNIDEILAVPGIDSIYVGPTDLGFSMGLPPILDREEPEILAIYARLVTKCAAAGIVAGIHVASAAYARRMLDMGFLWTSIGADAAFMTAAAKAAAAPAS